MTTYSLVCHTWPGTPGVLWELTITVGDRTIATSTSGRASDIRDFMFNRRIPYPPPSRRFLCKHEDGADNITRTFLPRNLDPFPRDNEHEE